MPTEAMFIDDLSNTMQVGAVIDFTAVVNVTSSRAWELDGERSTMF